MKRFFPTVAASALIVVGLACGSAGGAEPLRLGGTGASLGLMRALSLDFVRSAPGIEAEILPSLGSSGGIKAVHAGFVHVGTTSRALSAKEKALNVRPIPFVRSPIVFASSHRHPDGLTIEEIPRLYLDPSRRWHDGEPVTIIMRPARETSFTFLERHVPGLKDAFAAARSRPELTMAATDQDSAVMAQHVSGSLVILTLSQVITEKLNLRVLAINGIRPTETDTAMDRYPFVNTVYLVVRPDASNATRRFLAFLATRAARRIIARSGAAPLPIPLPISENASSSAAR